MANVYLKECNVLKTNQYNALQVWKLLEISKELYLFREGNNCVSLYYKVTEEDIGENKVERDFLYKFFKIGNLSEEDAAPVDKFLEARQNSDTLKDKNYNDDLFECRISKFDKEADEDKRISVAIFIKESEDIKKNDDQNKDQKGKEGSDKNSSKKQK